MVPLFRPWADLHADLFLPIVDRLPSPRDYVSVRAVCTAWRSALPSGPRSPSLLVLDDFQPHDDLPRYNTHPYALSLLIQRTFRLPTLPCHSSYVTGSSNGYLAIANDVDGRRPGILNSVTGEEIELLPLPNNRYPCRVVLGSNPRPDCYTVVAICDHDNVTKVAYMTSGDTEWTIADVAVDGAKLVDLAYDAGCSNVYYCLDERGDVQVLHIPRIGRMQEHTVEPLVAERVIGPRCFDAPAAFAPPYDIVAKKISFKRLFFCEGTLYQVWQNTRGKRLRAGGVFIMSSDEILVLRYYPERWPCWDAVKDLGGYSVLIGKNNMAVVQADAALGVRPNCVYWIDCRLCTPWVFDMSKRTSTHCVLPPTSVGFARCWYFNSG